VGATLTPADTRVTIARHDSTLGRWEMASRHAHPSLRGYVSSYIGYVEATSRPLRRREPATADVTLIISFGPTIDVLDPGEPERTAQRAASFVAGLSDVPVLIEHAGVQHGVEVNLTPLGARRLLGVPMHTLTNRVVDLEDLLGPDAALLVERLYEAPGWADRFDLLDAAIARSLADAAGASPEIAWAWGRLRGTHGAVPVTELARELGWSRRHLGVRFRDEIGLPPKLLARILRFDRVVALLRREDPDRWAEVAHGCGYYDQAHFNRDFREFAGTTPSAFLASRLPDGGGFAG
jgi:AraC-like DNA-binding protein